jgi:hypothetical protein
MRKDARCKDCGHTLAVHKIMVYQDDLEGNYSRKSVNAEGVNNKPLYHLTAYGSCKCMEFTR